MLGPLEVVLDGASVDLGTPRQRTLLALLLLNANTVLTPEQIIDALWGEHPPRTARNALQVAVHGLRQTLGSDAVSTHGEGYKLTLRESELDLVRFTDLVARATSEAPARAAATLQEALALHRGGALADLPDAPFIRVERERIEELRLLAVERRIDAELERSAGADLVAELEVLVAQHPFREGFRRQLMVALYRAGRQADALEAYRRARTSLVEELGMEPSRALQELEAAMLRQDPLLDGPKERTPASTTTLPHPARALVGRSLELAAVTALLRTPKRLVTLTGTGGTGKTRLALEVAWALADELSGGAHLVDLTPLTDPGLVAPAIGRALGVRDATGEELVERLAVSVGEHATLVVLDNVEHLLGAAPDVAELLARVPALRILATSREPLRIGFEQEYLVPPLRLPDREEGLDPDAVAQTEAVALFLERATGIRPDFVPSREEIVTIGEICIALDGLPLALELAAARLKLLSPAALLERLENRLGLLADGDRDLPERQRTLRATIDWSYDLLSPDERVLLARLSVFSGGWTVDAAEEVARGTLAALASLVEKSLVRSRAMPDGTQRLFMLETIREYALERLTESGELDTTRRRHAEHAARLAERLEPELHTPTGLDEAAREYDNVRAALEYSTSAGLTVVALRLCALARFWYVRGYLNEGRAWLERVLAGEGGPDGRRSRVQCWAATLAWSSGDNETAITRARQGLELAITAGDELAELRALSALGLAHLGAADLVRSRAFHSESLALARRLERDRDIALSLANIADVDYTLGDLMRAESGARESLEIFRRLDDREGMGVALLVLAGPVVNQGRAAEAVPLIVESIECFRAVEFKDFLATALVALARAGADSDPVRAARLMGASATIRAPLGPAQFPWEDEWLALTLERVHEQLGAERAQIELAIGASDPAGEIARAVG